MFGMSWRDLRDLGFQGVELLTRNLWVDPHFDNAIRNQIRLPRKTRKPGAMVRVRGKQFQRSGRRARRIADRNVQLVSGHNPERGISIFQSELMADYGDLDRPFRHVGILNGVDEPCCSHEENQHYEYRNHGPGKFHPITAVNLRRLSVTFGTPAELRDGVSDQTENNGKDDSGNGQDERRKMVGRMGRRRLRLKYAGNCGAARWARRA